MLQNAANKDALVSGRSGTLKTNKFKPVEKSIIEKRNQPRKCKKYVFFDVETGQIAFSYGGVLA